MKNHELLDRIGEVNEDFVLEAANNVVKPRFRWKTLAACAACAALALCAYPAWRMARTVHSQVGRGYEQLPLHEYTVVEGGATSTLEDMKAPAGGGKDILSGGENSGPDTLPGGAFVGDAPVQEAASEQYDKLLRGLGGQNGGEPETYPDWFAGAWLDGEKLVVSIVEGSRTSELEAEITGWCGDGVVFKSAKYSHSFLDGLMEPVAKALDGTGLSCGVGVDVTANCLGVDLYSDGADIPKEILVKLGQLDPRGDAIRVRLFTGKLDALTDEIKKGPAPGGTTETVFDGARVEPNEEAGPVSGGKNPVEELPEVKEAGQPAHYDILPLDE